MLKNSILLLLILLHQFTGLQSQENYQIGSSRVGIEPDSSTFSVALAGYGAPRDGRFTIEWMYQGKISPITSVSASGKNMYAIDANNSLSQTSIDNIYKWKSSGTTKNANLLAVLDNRFYITLANGDFEVRQIFTKNGYTIHSNGIKNLKAITGFNKKIYAVNDQNELYRIDIYEKKIDAKKIGHAPDIISMTTNEKLIFGLSSDNNIWKRGVGNVEDWIKIGRYNSITYDVKLRHIVIVKDRLYGIDENGKMYLAEHSSKGDLSASALAIKKKEKTVVIVGIDLRGFDHMLIDYVKKEITRSTNIPASAIFINASHTHFAPVVQAFPSYGAYMQMPDSFYLDRVRKSVIKSVELAISNMVPANLYFGRGTTKIGRNRSSANKQTPYDSTLDALRIEDKFTKTQNVLFLTGCHPVSRNTGRESFTMTANYPGVTRALVQKRTNAGMSIFLQGCGGDINPVSDDYNKTGMDLAIDVMKILNEKMEKIDGDISYSLDTILIPIIPWSKEKIEAFKIENSGKEGNVSAEKNVRWADAMISNYNNHTVPTTWPVYVQTLNIGNWKLVGLSREAVTEYGMAIKNLWPGKMVSVAGYTNDEVSYLPRDWHIQTKTYEGYDSFFWHSQPAILPTNVFDIIINRIKLLNR
ncbi:hypothetical protein [Flavitalea sp.]|nr:hypothetical protein [Flavitalea sp.]